MGWVGRCARLHIRMCMHVWVHEDAYAHAHAYASRTYHTYTNTPIINCEQDILRKIDWSRFPVNPLQLVRVCVCVCVCVQTGLPAA